MPRMKLFKNKKGLELEELGKAIIVVAVLVLIIILFIILSGKGTAALEYIKHLFRMG